MTENNKDKHKFRNKEENGDEEQEQQNQFIEDTSPQTTFRRMTYEQFIARQRSQMASLQMKVHRLTQQVSIQHQVIEEYKRQIQSLMTRANTSEAIASNISENYQRAIAMTARNQAESLDKDIQTQIAQREAQVKSKEIDRLRNRLTEYVSQDNLENVLGIVQEYEASRGNQTSSHDIDSYLKDIVSQKKEEEEP